MYNSIIKILHNITLNKLEKNNVGKYAKPITYLYQWQGLVHNLEKCILESPISTG